MLAFEIEDTIIAHGTIFNAEGDSENIKVSVDVVLDGQCAIPIPKKEGITKMTQEVGSHLMWPRHIVLTRNDKVIDCLIVLDFHASNYTKSS